MKLKLYAVAASFGDPTTSALSQVVASTWLAESAESATAMVTSKYYVDGGSRLALIGVSAVEITPEQMRHALEMIEKVEQAETPRVVPFSVVQQEVAPVAPEREPINQASQQSEQNLAAEQSNPLARWQKFQPIPWP